MQERTRSRALARESDEALWRKWSVRVAFDRWRRSQVAAKHTVLRRLYSNATFSKGKSALTRRGFERWVELHELIKKHQFSKLMQVADMRLSPLMSNCAEERNTLKGARILAVRWRKPILHKTFVAWQTLTRKNNKFKFEGGEGDQDLIAALDRRARGQHRRSLVLWAARTIFALDRIKGFRRRARRYYVRITCKRSWRLWKLSSAHRNATGKAATRAVRAMRNLGLTRGFRAWADATDPLAVVKAQKAVRMMRNLGLSRGMNAWIAATDPMAVVKAQKAARYMRNIGLSRGMRAWIDATDSAAAVNAQKAGRYMRNIGLSRGFKQWYAVTDTKAEQKAHKAVLAWRRLGLNKGLLAWIATWERERAEQAASKAVRGWKQNGLKRGWNGWYELWHAAVTEQKAQRL